MQELKGEDQTELEVLGKSFGISRGFPSQWPGDSLTL